MLNSGLASCSDQWKFPHELTIEEVHGLQQEITGFAQSFVGKMIQSMLAEKLNDQLTITRMERDFTNEGTRLRVSSAQSKIDLLILLAQPGMGLLDALYKCSQELTTEAER